MDFINSARSPQTRPCTRVRILPFHSWRCRQDLSVLRRTPLSFDQRRLCSHLARCRGRALPATLLPILPTEGGAKSSILTSLEEGLSFAPLRTLNFVFTCGEQNWRVFGLSSPDTNFNIVAPCFHNFVALPRVLFQSVITLTDVW